MTLQSFIAPSSPVIVHKTSPWHSPVPYLFGGLAAMLSLIAFALLILACSYSKHNNRENNEEGERDLEAGNMKPDSNNDKELPHVFEEKYLVIMAGQANPTFLATPVSSRPTLVYSCSCQRNVSENSSTCEENEKDKEGDQLQVRSNMGDHDTSDRLA
uniref:protein GLUTAMINE DUMPER 2-like n=1 Tax=Erigeron canadensis TaxID=72917 RepID=UPI001CB96978|nr:protein GLUTAMINE DUMPER 2-like [Erigeron canadensis]